MKPPDWSAVSSSYNNGTFDTGIVWSNNGATPYEFYRGVMSTEMVQPVGKQATENYHRFGDKKADKLIDAFAAATDERTQREQTNGLQELYNKDAPVVPLFTGPEWGAYTTPASPAGPTEENPYATLGNRNGSTVLVLTSLKPVKS